MKKIMILLAVVCGISGCRLKEPSDPQTGVGHDPVVIRQGGESISLYELMVFNKGYDKKTNTWVAGDGAHVSDVLAEVAEDLPSAALKNDFEVQIPETSRFYYMDIFDEAYEKVLRKYPDSDESGEGLTASETCMNYLEELSCGTYYISIGVVEEGDYIESEGQRETTGYEYAFRLDRDTPPQPLSGEDGRELISGEMILQYPKDKVCIAVMPTEISMEGGDYRYIICPESENSMKVFERAVASADISKGLQEGDESQGIWVLYQDDWWCLLRSGALVGNGRIEAEDGEELWTICLETARAAGLSEAVRPKEIAGIENARLEWDGTAMITDAASLKKIEGWLSSSEELYGGAKCPFGAKLILQMKNGKEVTLSMATDSCGIWLSEGVYYQYAGGNEAFYDLFGQAGQ